MADETKLTDRFSIRPDIKRGVGVAAGVGSGRHRGVIELPYLDGVQHAAFPEAA